MGAESLKSRLKAGDAPKLCLIHSDDSYLLRQCAEQPRCKRGAGCLKIVGAESLKSRLKAGDAPKLCLIHSDDSYLLRQCAELYIKSVGEIEPRLNLLQLDGRVRLPVDSAAEFLMSFPFMGSTKLLIVDELIPSTENIDKASFERLLDALRHSEASSKSLITMRSAEVNAKNTNAGRAKKLIELADSTGLTVEAPMLTKAEFIRTISAMAQDRGCTLEVQAAALLYEDFSGRLTESVLELEKLCSYRPNGKIDEDTVRLLVVPTPEAKIFAVCDMLLSRQLGRVLELEKLCSYRPNGKIDEDTVRLLVVPTPEAKIFAVCDMLLSRQLGRAQLELSKLFFHRHSPESINQIICMTLSDIYLASIAQESGSTQANAAAELRYYGGQAYRLKKQWQLAKRLGTGRLLRAVRHAVSVDMKMKQSGTYSHILLETELVELYGILYG